MMYVAVIKDRDLFYGALVSNLSRGVIRLELQHTSRYATFEDAVADLRALAPAREDVAVVAIGHGYTTIVGPKENRPATPGVHRATYPARLGTMRLQSEAPADELPARADYILSEAGCVAAVAEVSLADALPQAGRTLLLWFTAERVHLLMFNRAELTAYDVETPADVTTDAVRDALERLFLKTPVGNAESVVIGGWTPAYLNNNVFNWVRELTASEYVNVIETGQLVVAQASANRAGRNNLQLEDEGIEFGNLGKPLTRWGMAALLTAACHQVAEGIGADFTGTLQSDRQRAGTGLAAGMKSIAKIGDRATGWMKRGAAAGIAAGLVGGMAVGGVQYVRALRRTNDLQTAIEKAKIEEAANTAIEKEAAYLKKAKEVLNQRIQTITAQREGQIAAYTITTDVGTGSPAGLVLSKLTIKERTVVIEGYVTTGSATAAPKPTGSDLTTTTSAPTVDVGAIASRFVQALESSGRFSDVQTSLNQTGDTKCQITITCTYTGKIATGALPAETVGQELVRATGQVAPPQTVQ